MHWRRSTGPPVASWGNPCTHYRNANDTGWTLAGASTQVRRLDAARLMLPLAGLRNVASDPQSANLMKVIMPLYGGNPSLLRPFGRDGKPLPAHDEAAPGPVR